MTNVCGSRYVPALVCALAVLAAAPLAVTAQSISQLTDYKIGIAGPPAITADGQTIWTGGALDYGSNPLARFQLFKFDRTTGAATQMTTFAHGVVPASIDLTINNLVSVSDDGMWVAFVAVSDPLGTNPDRSSELFVMDSTGGQLAQLTNDPNPNAGSVTSISMAGTGNRIAFTSTSDLVTGMNPLNRENVFVIDRTGTNLLQLTDLPSATFSGGVTISNDGTKIGFAFNGNLGDLDGDGTDDNDDFSYEVFTILNDGTDLRQITDGDGWNSTNVRISGDGAKIVYQSNDDPSGATGGNNKNQEEIFIIDWDGSSNWRQLTDSKANVINAEPQALNPSISDTDPDGSGHIITFGSTHATTAVNEDGNGEVYRIRSDGTDFWAVTDSTFSDGSGLPVISGDGSTIVLYSLDDLDGTANAGFDNDDISPELFVMDDSDDNGDGTYNVNAVQLSAGLLGVNTMPQLTPNGTILTFVSDADLDGSDVDRGGEIYKMNPDGTGRVQVTNLFTGGISAHDISPDGLRIAFSSDSDPDGSNADQGVELFFINASGTGLERVTDEQLKDKRVFNISFNSTGSFIYFDWNGNEGSNPENNREVWRSNTTSPYTLQQLTARPTKWRHEKPRLSGNDQWIVYQLDADDDSDGTHTWQVNRASAIDGSNEFVICGDAAYECVEPDVSFDGSVVVFSSNGDLVPGMNTEGNYELFKYDFGTATTTQLTSATTGASNAPRISGDGAWAYFKTNAPIFETDPDRPSHFARVNLTTLAIERIDLLSGGFVETMDVESTGQFIVLSRTGNPILQNWDNSEELFRIDHNLPAGGVSAIGISPGPAPTTLSVPQWIVGPMRYDFLRGNLADLQVLGGEVSLGAAVCVENDSLDLDTAGDEDLVNPPAGQGFFYLWRGDEGHNRVNSWGTSTGGLERIPQAGTGCLPN